ncbi:MAG TPA: prepilin-type N-terminal cleavage/methylation domain-containing protein [Candidatus Acidoferrum sp.]|nr:prepilin-type N-terminal cleavage/methylation domain-containing protein [Candidatus Acidoferrum sp.]
MRRRSGRAHERGFTLIEMIVSVAIFVALCGAMFSLLGMTQKRTQTESQVVDSFEQARLGLDQIVQDVTDAGYPPASQFAVLPPANKYAVTPFGWSPNYPATPCQIGTAGGGTCVIAGPGLNYSPGDFDLVLEGDVDGSGVKWTRYQLLGTTLYRGVTPKVVGSDPITATSVAGVMVPYIQNVMNNAAVSQIAQISAAYPTMFPGGNAQPIFQYSCDTPAGTVLCQNAGINNAPQNIRDVEVTLIVMTPRRDAQSGKLRIVELNGRGRRSNPNR